MTGWQFEKIQTLRFIDNDRTMFEKVAEWAKELGFEYCAFTIRSPIPLSNPSTFVATNYPESWQSAYAHHDFISIDPVIKLGLRSEEMFVWSDSLFSEAKAFWKAARESGLRHGLSIPTRGTHGVVGLLSLARSSNEILKSELADIEFKLLWLGQIAHQGMSKHLPLNANLVGALTKREISVLQWTAEGKTSFEIAEILKISESTVNFHIKNAVQKLGTSNKTAAAVQAALLGLLH